MKVEEWKGRIYIPHFLTNCNPFTLAYLSMNLMNRSHSLGVLITYFASIREGFPLTNLAVTSTDWRTPSSSIMKKPVISPTSPDESKTEGCSKLNIAIPLVPSFDLVSFTSGIVCSSVPWMNWIVGLTIIVIPSLRTWELLRWVQYVFCRRRGWPLNEDCVLRWTAPRPPTAMPMQQEKT